MNSITLELPKKRCSKDIENFFNEIKQMKKDLREITVLDDTREEEFKLSRLAFGVAKGELEYVEAELRKIQNQELLDLFYTGNGERLIYLLEGYEQRKLTPPADADLENYHEIFGDNSADKVSMLEIVVSLLRGNGNLQDGSKVIALDLSILGNIAIKTDKDEWLPVVEKWKHNFSSNLGNLVLTDPELTERLVKSGQVILRSGDLFFLDYNKIPVLGPFDFRTGTAKASEIIYDLEILIKAINPESVGRITSLPGFERYPGLKEEQDVERLLPFHLGLGGDIKEVPGIGDRSIQDTWIEVYRKIWVYEIARSQENVTQDTSSEVIKFPAIRRVAMLSAIKLSPTEN